MLASHTAVAAIGAAMSLVTLGACHRTPDEPAHPASTVAETPATLTAANTQPALAPSAASTPPPASVALQPPAATRPGQCVDKDVSTGSPTPRAASTCPAPDSPPPRLERVKVKNASGTLVIDAEVAKTSADTTRGLMWRTKMADGEGMIFDLRDRAMHAFWMRNTCIPLDMLFIDVDGTVVGIYENVPVLNDQERAVACPSRYVLEVNAGYTRQHKIVPGDKLSW